MTNKEPTFDELRTMWLDSDNVELRNVELNVDIPINDNARMRGEPEETQTIVVDGYDPKMRLAYIFLENYNSSDFKVNLLSKSRWYRLVVTDMHHCKKQWYINKNQELIAERSRMLDEYVWQAAEKVAKSLATPGYVVTVDDLTVLTDAAKHYSNKKEGN